MLEAFTYHTKCDMSMSINIRIQYLDMLLESQLTQFYLNRKWHPIWSKHVPETRARVIGLGQIT